MAGRIRSIKPEFIDDEKLGAMRPIDRLLFACSWLLADDYGNFRANPKWVKSQAFCYDDETTVDDVSDSIGRLVAAGMFVAYSVRGQSYIHTRNWDKHQKVDKPGKPHCPGLSENDNSVAHDVGVIRETLAKVLETNEKAPETLAPDQDQDQDQDQERTTTTTGGGGGCRGSIQCPPDLTLTDDQRSTLETAMIPGWAIDAITVSFVASSLVGSQPRPLDAWRKCLARAVAGDWNNPKRRPKRPEPDGAPKPKTIDADSLGVVL